MRVPRGRSPHGRRCVAGRVRRRRPGAEPAYRVGRAMTAPGANEVAGGRRRSAPVESQSDIAGRGLWTAAETARCLTVPERMVRRLVAERRIAYVKVGRYVRFRPEDVQEWRDGHVHPAVVVERRHLFRCEENMMPRTRRTSGGVDKLPSGRYRARVIGPDARRHTRTFATKADADAWSANQRTDMSRGDWIDPNTAVDAVLALGRRVARPPQGPSEHLPAVRGVTKGPRAARLRQAYGWVHNQGRSPSVHRGQREEGAAAGAQRGGRGERAQGQSVRPSPRPQGASGGDGLPHSRGDQRLGP